MHLIEPFYLWRDYYISEEDENAINFGFTYSEFEFTSKIYNYVIHPQWDNFGSETLFYKLIYVDYEEEFCVIEFIGEWNDVINNDIMLLKTELIENLINCGIQNFVLIVENVLNFHGMDTDYYEEWVDEIEGEIFLINALPHVIDEMKATGLGNYMLMENEYNDVNWRNARPDILLNMLRNLNESDEDAYILIE